MNLRDYKSDVEAIVASKLATWKIQHFGLWADVVETPTGPPPCVATAAELVDLEDQAQAARYREVRAKMAQDCAAMTLYNSQMEENKRRAHVVHVMRQKGQHEVGAEFLILLSFRVGFAQKMFFWFILYNIPHAMCLSQRISVISGFVRPS